MPAQPPPKSIGPLRDEMTSFFQLNGDFEDVKEDLWMMFRDSLEVPSSQQTSRADLYKSLIDLIKVMSEYQNR